jgi:FHS family L-fucose permease-like MFS transporter
MIMFTTADGKNRIATFLLVCGIFCLSGLCNGMIDVFNRHFKDSLNLTDAQSAFVQGAWYGAYFLMAFPGGMVARRFGYRCGIVTGLTIILIGSLVFIPVTRMTGETMAIYAAFLATLFAVGAGFTFLETVANPYATVLGPPEAASSRINLAQSFNAIGWILGPMLGGKFTLGAAGPASNDQLYIPYLVVAGIVALFLILTLFTPVPNLNPEEKDASPTQGVSGPPLAREWHFIFGWVSQFLYVAGQVGIFAFFITYVLDRQLTPALAEGLARMLPSEMCELSDDGWHITKGCAPYMLSLAFLLFAVGRFSGSAIQTRIAPHRVLGIYASVNCLLMLLVIANFGWVSVFALIVSFFFMSIMYPTNFALGIRGLGAKTKLASSFMVTAIIGGAVMPWCMGHIIEQFGWGYGFVMPLVCFLFIAFYGFTFAKWYARDAGAAAKDPVMAGH